MRRDCLNVRFICQFWCAHVVSTSLHVVGMKQDLLDKENTILLLSNFTNRTSSVYITKFDSYFAPLISESP